MAQQPSAPAASDPIDYNDVQLWTDRFSEFAADPNGTISSKSAEGSASWTNMFFNCFTPPDLCLTTCFLPCVTFGKTHHRLYKDANLKGYEPINTTCLLYCGSRWLVPGWAIPVAMQRAAVRAKYNLEGNCIMDLVLACCCDCCSIIQMEKEVIDRQGGDGQNKAGYVAQTDEMVYPQRPGA